jgi:hypothetical protein
LLPFVVAARSGDRGAERELLSRIGPVVLEITDPACTGKPSEQTALALDTLLTVLKALPTFRGDEPTTDIVTRIARQRVRALGKEPLLSEAQALTAGRLRVRRGRRGDESGRVEALVDRALEDDASILVSHIFVRSERKSKRTPYIALGVLALLLACALGYWVAHATRGSSESRGPAVKG